VNLASSSDGGNSFDCRRKKIHFLVGNDVVEKKFKNWSVNYKAGGVSVGEGRHPPAAPLLYIIAGVMNQPPFGTCSHFDVQPCWLSSPRDPGTTIRARQVRGLHEIMYTTEPTMNEPQPQSFEREYSPEDTFKSVEELRAEEEQAIAGLDLWSSMNRVCDHLHSIGMGDLARAVADAFEEEEIPF
jgi:hypothetical protein